MKYCDTCRSTYPADFSVCPKDQSALREVEDLAPGMVLRGKYEILERIGIGGMASVYRARHLTFDEIRAIKVVSSQLAKDDAFLKRFKNEAIITRKLRHPNAVRIDDFDTTEDGRPFIVMDYVEGKSLRSILHRDGAVPAQRAVRLARQVAAALAAAHALGIVHRDIKPDNILVVPMPQNSDYGADIAKVLDFGIATLREGSVKVGQGYTPTQTGMVVGTPQYISPEQAMGKPGSEIDGRADLYSLGVVLYEMLTGRLPFEADSPMGILLHHLQTQPQPPHTVRPDLGIPEDVSLLVMRALEKEPAKRFQTADEMMAALSDPQAWSRTAVLGSGAIPAVAAPAASSAGSEPADDEFEVRPAGAASGQIAASADVLDLLYTANAAEPPASPKDAATPKFERRESNLAGWDMEDSEPAAETKAAPTAFVASPPAPVVKPEPKPAPKPAPASAAKPTPPPPRPRPTLPPVVPAKPASAVTRPAVKKQETVFDEAKVRRSMGLPPEWRKGALYVAAAVVVVAGLLFAWSRYKPSASPPASDAGAAPVDEATDARIYQNVKEALRNSPALRRVPISVGVHGAVVTLSGRTAKASVPGAAQVLAEGVPGVRRVENHIELVQGGGAGAEGAAAPQAEGSGAPSAAPSASRQPAPFGGAGEEAPPVPGQLKTAVDPGVQQLRVQQAIDLGNYRLSQQDYQGAIHAFQTALSIDPNNAAAREGLRRAQAGR